MRVCCIITVLFLSFLFACNSPVEDANAPLLFQKMSSEKTGINFQNQVDYTEEFNVYTYRNFYNGGGVGLGDINNDGLLDIFFCGNLVPNRLYINKGNFQFEDITSNAGVASEGVWSTGVSMVDVNGDGLLDIYVCKSGDPSGDKRYNELFINNGNLTFTEMAIDYGIADKGLSTHAAFFDYDKDGDLDCYLLNNSFKSVGGYDLIKDQRTIRDPNGGNKLYRNELINSTGESIAKFTDVSEEAGIYGSAIGFGLGVTIGDVDRDGWQDIYVSNDFFERDYLYLNQMDGTFEEVLEEQIREISLGSMGADMGDINNDGYPEIFVTDMLPEDDARMKTKTQFDNWDKYMLNVSNGYYHQFTRNMLQLNNRNHTFSEIGRLSGVHATDWSWGALMMDMNNDGLNDIFVANGIYKDLTDQDYINFMADPETVRRILDRENKVIVKLVDGIPSVPLSNYAFINNGDLTFTNLADSLGLGNPGFSNGSAYGDLDNDGDLDLVVNNVNMPSDIYRNNTDKLINSNYLLIELKGKEGNQFAVGSQVSVYAGGKIFYRELVPYRGFQSTVDHRVHIGLGSITAIDSLKVIWPDQTTTTMKDLLSNQRLVLDQEEAGIMNEDYTSSIPIFRESIMAEKVEHIENKYIDFDRDRLLYHMLSTEGPAIGVSDVNGDGREDFYLCGAKGYSGTLYIQTSKGDFKLSFQESFSNDKASEDTDCLFGDFNSDGYPDLIVASGGNEFSSNSIALQDRLYLNDGKGNFTRSPEFRSGFESTGVVKAADFDNDGDLDLFTGSRLVPYFYGVPANSHLWENDGNGQLEDISGKFASELNSIGMVTDASWADIDNDQDLDLVIVGDWMDVKVFLNDKGKFSQSKEHASSSLKGWWNTLVPADIDKDGDVDFFVGNHGINTRFKVSLERPATLYVNDFDRNRTAEQIICVYNGDNSYPLALRHDLMMQLPGLKKKYLKYENYKEQQISDIFTKEELENTIISEVTEGRSGMLINQEGKFEFHPLPMEAQFSPIYAILYKDFDGDGIEDVITGGNFYNAKPEVGKYDSSYGFLFKGDGKGNFTAIPATESGLVIKGEVRDFAAIRIDKTNTILIGKNNDAIQFYTY